MRISDETSSSLLSHLQGTTAFIDAALANGGVVFVHCTMGVSRSPACVIAFLMSRYRWPLHIALRKVRDRRQGIRPNRGFLEQLVLWEARLFGRAETDVDRLPV